MHSGHVTAKMYDFEMILYRNVTKWIIANEINISKRLSDKCLNAHSNIPSYIIGVKSVDLSPLRNDLNTLTKEYYP